ncbi:hypothetical protein ACFWQG_17915 [Rhodococcus sp. NPDC058532]|uniref:hypothetical protein n=1 Tax=Rhodococcus sp. NPDC058532 TaxID=3346540 RepID=UPI0036507111
MARVRTTIRAVGLVIAATAIAACGSRDYPGADLDALPAAAVGAVSVTPAGLETTDLLNQNRSLTFLFDADGDVVGRLEGNDVYATQAVASAGRLTMVSADAVTTLTPAGRAEVGIDEHMVTAAANDPANGAATIWFNSGGESTYVAIDTDGTATTGAVPGVVEVAAQCGDRAVALTQGRELADADGRWLFRLVELPAGGEPVERGRWRLDPDFSAASASAVCTADGSALLSLHRPPPPPDGGERGLVLVRTRLADGERTAEPVELAGQSPATSRGSLTVVGDRLYWLTQSGTVLSMPLGGPAQARSEWTIPGADVNIASVSGTTVSALDLHAAPTFAQYDLVTGERITDPVTLPWLTEIVDSEAESGNTAYVVSDLDGLLPRSDD